MTILRFMRVAANTDLPLPARATAAAAGLDLRACLPEGPIVLEPGAVTLVPTGFRVALPEGTEMQIRPRSGLATRHAILIPNSPGTVDADYRGEVKVALMNLGGTPFPVAHADRIAQAVVATLCPVEVREVDKLDRTARGEGGFGSTGQAG